MSEPPPDIEGLFGHRVDSLHSVLVMVAFYLRLNHAVHISVFWSLVAFIHNELPSAYTRVVSVKTGHGFVLKAQVDHFLLGCRHDHHVFFGFCYGLSLL